MVTVEIDIPEEFSNDGYAWLWEHPDINAFVCGISFENIKIRINDLRLFKAIIQQTNIAIYKSCGKRGECVIAQDIDVFIEKYQPEEPNNKTTT
jgi:hypothetical protein